MPMHQEKSGWKEWAMEGATGRTGAA